MDFVIGVTIFAVLMSVGTIIPLIVGRRTQDPVVIAWATMADSILVWIGLLILLITVSSYNSVVQTGLIIFWLVLAGFVFRYRWQRIQTAKIQRTT